MAEKLLSAAEQHKKLLKEISRLQDIQQNLRNKYKDSDSLYKFNLEKANEAFIARLNKSNDKYIKNFAKGTGFNAKLDSLINRQIALEQYMGSKYRTVGTQIPEMVSVGGFKTQEGSGTRGINPDYNEQFDKDFPSGSDDTSFSAFRGSMNMNTVRSNLAIQQAKEAEDSQAEDAFIESETQEWGPAGQPSAEVQMKLSDTYSDLSKDVSSAGTNKTSTRERLNIGPAIGKSAMRAQNIARFGEAHVNALTERNQAFQAAKGGGREAMKVFRKKFGNNLSEYLRKIRR